MKNFLHFSNYAAIILLSAVAISPAWQYFYKIAILCWLIIPAQAFVYIQSLREEQNFYGLRVYIVFLCLNFTVWILLYMNNRS